MSVHDDDRGVAASGSYDAVSSFAVEPSLTSLHAAPLLRRRLVLYMTSHCIALHHIALHRIALHYIALHHTTSHYITLHHIALHRRILLPLSGLVLRKEMGPARVMGGCLRLPMKKV